MKRALGALLLLASLSGGGNALAEVRKGSWEISPYAGFFFGSTRLVDGVDPTAGIRVGYNLDRWWQFELGYSQLSGVDAIQPVGRSRIQGLDEFGRATVLEFEMDGTAETDFTSIDFNILLATQPLHRRWVFYGTGGWGLSDFDGTLTQANIDQNFPLGPDRAAFDVCLGPNGEAPDGDTNDTCLVDGVLTAETEVPQFICPSCKIDRVVPGDPSSDRYLPDGSLDTFDSTQWSLGLGTWYRLTDVMSLRLDLRYIGGLSENYSAQVVTAGLSFRVGGESALDDDDDGIPSFRDLCVDTPIGATVDSKGCPADTDGDEILDGLDQCPGTPEGWPVEPDGCPTDTDGDGVPDGRDACADTLEGAVVDFEGCAVDSDGDGVPDGIDQCALTPQGAAVDAEGCPIDTDGDGVYDGLDQCTGTASDLTVDRFGCPVDSDGDGLKDDVDACRDFAGPGGIDEEGCPALRLDKAVRFTLPAVSFGFGSSVLTDEAQVDLVPLLAAMTYYGDVTIEIEGHTDDIGSERENFLVSLERAQAVRQWLIDGAIVSERVVVRGFGETRPIADNSTDEGRSENRRIEILVTGTLGSGGDE